MLDHLVLGTPDLEATVRDIAHRTGAQPSSGGAHTGLGTRNYLLGLGGDSYLEIVGPDPHQPEPEGLRPFDIDTLEQARLVTWAIRTEDMATSIDAARVAGYNPGQPQTMERLTPDGRTLRWQLTLNVQSGHTGLLPFLIDWGDTPHPAESLPHVPLRDLWGVHPEPASIEPALTALDAHLPLHTGDPAGLRAIVPGPHGPVTLW